MPEDIKYLMKLKVDPLHSQKSHNILHLQPRMAVLQSRLQQLDVPTRSIQQTASTDAIGDGKIFVLDLASATRIRTGETGETAL